MKRWITAVLSAALLLTGCKARELEDRAFVQALELDLRNGELTGGFGEYMLAGDSLADIIMANQNRMDRYLDMGHVKTIVFGEALFEEKERLARVLGEIEEQPLIARSSRVFIYNYKDGESYLKQIAETGKEPGRYLSDLYDNNPYRGSSVTTLEELLAEEL